MQSSAFDVTVRGVRVAGVAVGAVMEALEEGGTVIGSTEEKRNEAELEGPMTVTSLRSKTWPGQPAAAKDLRGEGEDD